MIVTLAIVAGAALLLTTRPQPVQIVVNPPVPTETPSPTTTPAPLQVYITGAVRQPQITVELPPGSRVQDAVEAAGGLAEDADLDRINLAGLLSDGDQVHVFPRTAEVLAEEALPTPTGGEVVNINTANVATLEMLPGIGPALAQEIIAYRSANGPFTSLEDLDAVPGIGPALLEQLAPLVVFE